ncbi:hypothetical protein DICVIV_11656 [Dictyocaulus viviparus]|uniref:Uncharacterized protein n=1 Tax=Dictyocaulus viviparus TaxID=29172 RepID=A0A0D8XCL4_DICVI|nr:hypothetical protein DICVIV_11656 [Dictyocaulus viviparus]
MSMLNKASLFVLIILFIFTKINADLLCAYYGTDVCNEKCLQFKLIPGQCIGGDCLCMI